MRYERFTIHRPGLTFGYHLSRISRINKLPVKLGGVPSSKREERSSRKRASVLQKKKNSYAYIDESGGKLV
jgi:hypothetical protein